MHALKWLHKTVANALPLVHRRRLDSVFSGVSGLLNGQHLSLTGVGRHVPGSAKEKHKIKRIDRLLGNPHLRSERSEFYRWMCHMLLGNTRHPNIIVDWSDIDTGKQLFLLRAAVSVGGRALVVYEEVHARYHHPNDTSAFLKHLADCLPMGCQPIIVTDAGFKSPWFRAVTALGWYYVGRVRHRDFVRFATDNDWFPAKALYDRATSRPKALGELWIPRATPMLTRAYLYRKHPKGRVRLTAKGKRRRNGPSLKHEKREREPWLLISNLPSRRHLEKRIVAIYRERMTIEEAFRDLKAYRHGFAFRHNLGRNPERIANLLLIAALATWVVWLTGLIGKARGLAHSLQANTEKRRCVLSTFFIGTRLLSQPLKLCHQEILSALERIAIAIGERTLDDVYF
jgi:hypothetical protein